MIVIDSPLFQHRACILRQQISAKKQAEQTSSIKPQDEEQLTNFELVVNLKAAKQIGLTIRPNVLTRGERIIR